jgi:hypothetical protein
MVSSITLALGFSILADLHAEYQGRYCSGVCAISYCRSTIVLVDYDRDGHVPSEPSRRGLQRSCGSPQGLRM